METLKDTVGFAVEVTNQIKEATADGKIGIWEIAALAGRAVGIARIIKKPQGAGRRTENPHARKAGRVG